MLLETVRHNPYFSRWFSAIIAIDNQKKNGKKVTILILVDGFLQYGIERRDKGDCLGHNPYFSRWFSAIKLSLLQKQGRKKSQSLF